jgi:hypothetical protein
MNKAGEAGADAATPTEKVASLRRQGFAPEEIVRLVELRERSASERFGELMGNINRLRFARWLYEQGKIAG